MSDYFPPELVVVILLKLPVKSLIRFTTVCKSWHSIITSPSFISSHLDQPKTQTLLLLRRYDTQDHLSLLEVAEKNSPFCIISSSELELPFLKSENESFKIVGSCRGIVCLSDDYSRYKRTVLWNPSIRKHLVLPDGIINDQGKPPRERVLGFGAADNNNDFKIVRLVYRQHADGFIYRPSPQAEVFSLRTWSWRRLRGIGVHVRFQIHPTMWSQVFLNGVVHWLGSFRIEMGHSRNSILCFRVGEEVFDEITLPCELAGGLPVVLTLSLTAIEESLAVIRYNKHFGEAAGCDVWLMAEYGVESSWRRCYSFPVMEGMGKVLALRKNDEALVVSRDVGLVAFDYANWEAKNLGMPGTTHSFCLENYVESLEMLGGDGKITKKSKAQKRT